MPSLSRFMADGGADSPATKLLLEELESRCLLDASAGLVNGMLVVSGTPDRDRLELTLDPAAAQIVLLDRGMEVARFNSADVGSILVDVGEGDDSVRIDRSVTQPASVRGGGGRNLLTAGGGPTTLQGGSDTDKLIAGTGGGTLLGGAGNDLVRSGGGPANLIDGGAGFDRARNVQAQDTVVAATTESVTAQPVIPSLGEIARGLELNQEGSERLTPEEVEALIKRAAAATASEDAIIAVVDRPGRILGVRAESQVNAILGINGGAPGVPADEAGRALLTFAVDGAVALARTGAFFGNNQGPLTSRVIQAISETTMTQREIDSNPNIRDRNSPDYGPGFVAATGVKSHFPAGIAFTPQVDLFAIEHTNRDQTRTRLPANTVIPDPPAGSTVTVAADGTRTITYPDGAQIIQPPAGSNQEIIRITPADRRFNSDIRPLTPDEALPPPDSYGVTSGIFVDGQSRGIGTLPGGIPIYKNGKLVGGIGVFFPGKTGYATESNSSISTTFDPTKPDRTLEAEFMGLAAVGGAPGLGFPVGDLPGAPLPAGFQGGLPLNEDNQRVDLVGLFLDLVGPDGRSGPARLVSLGLQFGLGNPDNGANLPVTPGGDLFRSGRTAPAGWLVTPRDAPDGSITAAQVELAIINANSQSFRTRAAIRLPLDTPARFVFAISDKQGNILGLFRQPDATIFSIDVAVAKARNAAYYSDAAQLQAVDDLVEEGLAPGVAVTARTFRFLSQPRFPEGIDGAPPGPFSVLNDGGADRFTGLQTGPRLPGSAHQSVQGHDAFNPQTNFRDPGDPRFENGIVFFPGSYPLFRDVLGTGFPGLVGALGVSGDGVDQDDVTTFAGANGFYVPPTVARADQVKIRNVRLPFQKFNRQPIIM